MAIYLGARWESGGGLVEWAHKGHKANKVYNAYKDLKDVMAYKGYQESRE